MDLSLYWGEFLTIAGVHLLAVASPGPDFAIVLKHSINYGRRIAMITSIGVGVAILLHVTYSLLGIGLLLKTNPLVYTIFSYVAAAYLVYIAIGALKSKAADTTEPASEVSSSEISDRKAFAIGFLTNGLNPKATLFFLSVFAVAVSAQTPSSIKLAYGVYLAVATGMWFCFLSYLLSTRKVRAFIRQYSHWFDRIMGAVLLLLAAKLVIV
ncbi:MAG: LysE family translocator [Paraglaciecola chathamensis]|jgi:RhtB (resistance to homoserine/threonine) family protein|uniref:LysE family transporter n=1 Tax=Paraglaciecola chathamensis TaxID=368405 RepID=A0ABS0WBB0_9ALTE|nr:LysE family transporter [Paraglaciecola chathamensis]MBJ2135767.1 LysE family transporter [Paraglaciecola chathamensis]MDO6557681.1 LysE family transporter [Paraglaciecola chathamensis]